MKIWKNTFWNLLGLVVPALISIPAVAVMARMLEIEKFGIFMLAFSLLGYAGIFDGGVTRAVIRSIASNKGKVEEDRLIMGTATWTVSALSIIAAIFLYIYTEKIVNLLNISHGVRIDVIQAFNYLALIIPASLLTIVWFSYLEGRQEFLKLSMYKTFTGSLVAVLPVLALYVQQTLSSAILGLLLARIFTLSLAYFSCRLHLGKFLTKFNRETFRELFTFGGWITLSNIISPLMVYADRFILSNIVGANRVAFYTAPAEAIAKISIIPGALAKTLFPLFSDAQSNAASAANHAYKGLLLILLIIVFPTFFFSHEILNLWLGKPYGDESGGIFQILLIGFLFNSLAQIPFARIQGQGRAKTTALIHLCELIPYVLTLAVLVHFFGITGAAIAWSLRVTVDYIALEHFSRQLKQ